MWLLKFKVNTRYTCRRTRKRCSNEISRVRSIASGGDTTARWKLRSNLSERVTIFKSFVINSIDLLKMCMYT